MWVEIAAPAEGVEPDGSWYAMVPGDGALYLVEAHESQIVTVAPDGMVTRLIDASVEDPTFTDIAVAPDGGVYVGGLGHFPYINGSTKVFGVSSDNTQETVMSPGTGRVVRMTGPDGVETVVTGLTVPVHIGFSPDGALYIASPAAGADTGTGSILRVALTGARPVATPAA